MPLSDDFVHRDLISKHGSKGKPGYRLLHPGTLMGSAYRTPEHEKRLVRFGGLLQAGKHEEAQALLDRTSNLTPSQKKMVQEDITAAASKRKRAPAKPKEKAVKPKEATVIEESATEVVALAVQPEEQPASGEYTLPTSITSRMIDNWLAEINKAQDADTLEEIELRILDTFDDPSHPAQDELQDAINRRHREHFERDRYTVTKWLSRRGIIRKHGNKGAPGYELLHPNSMLRGKRSPKQEERLKKLGTMLQRGDNEGAQVLLDRTLNLSDEDRKIVQGQIGAGSKGQDGGKSKEAPEHSPKGDQAASKAPVAVKDTPKPKKAPERASQPAGKPVQDVPASEDNTYPPDLPDEPQDLRKATSEQENEYFTGSEAWLGMAANEDELAMIAEALRKDRLKPTLKSEMEELIGLYGRRLNTMGGVSRLPQNGETKYERAKASISKALNAVAKSVRAMMTKPKKMTSETRQRGVKSEGRDPVSSPAGKHLKEGGSISDSPADGLWDFIQARPGRFKVVSKPSGEGSVSDVFFVTDSSNGERHFFKRALNGGEAVNPDTEEIFDPQMHGDGANEIIGAALGNAAMPGQFVGAAYAEDSGLESPMIRFEHLDSFVKSRGGSDLNTNTSDQYSANPTNGAIEVVEGAEPLADRAQAIRIHIYDYLMANSDRHGGNLVSYSTSKGRVLVPIDNGASGHAMTAQVRVEGNETLEQTLLEPETVPYDVWQTQWGMNLASGAKTRIIRAEIIEAYKGDTAAMKSDAEKALKEFRKVNAREEVAKLRKQYGTLDPYEQAHIDAAATIWENRMKMIDAEDIVTVMS